MTATRRPSVSRLLARRAAEDTKLRDALETLRAERVVLDERIREVEELLGVSRPPVTVSARRQPAPGDEVRCADCGVHVPAPENAGERDSECPACHASPFEASRGAGAGGLQ